MGYRETRWDTGRQGGIQGDKVGYRETRRDTGRLGGYRETRRDTGGLEGYRWTRAKHGEKRAMLIHNIPLHLFLLIVNISKP